LKKFIKIIRYPYEEPYHINLIIEASNGECTGQLEIYENPSRLKELANVLEDFAFNKTNNYIWELGSEKSEDNFAYYFKCEISLIRLTSRCCISLRLNNNEKDIEKSISEFSILCDPAELHKLGQLFREFSKLEKKTLTWTGTEGSVF